LVRRLGGEEREEGRGGVYGMFVDILQGVSLTLIKTKIILQCEGYRGELRLFWSLEENVWEL
jgi:hypothetical protein